MSKFLQDELWFLDHHVWKARWIYQWQWKSDCASLSIVFPSGPFIEVQQHSHRVNVLKEQREIRKEGRGQGKQERNHRTWDELSSLVILLSVCTDLTSWASLLSPDIAFPSEDQGKDSVLWNSKCRVSSALVLDLAHAANIEQELGTHKCQQNWSLSLWLAACNISEAAFKAAQPGSSFWVTIIIPNFKSQTQCCKFAPCCTKPTVQSRELWSHTLQEPLTGGWVSVLRCVIQSKDGNLAGKIFSILFLAENGDKMLLFTVVWHLCPKMKTRMEKIFIWTFRGKKKF